MIHTSTVDSSSRVNNAPGDTSTVDSSSRVMNVPGDTSTVDSSSRDQQRMYHQEHSNTRR